MLSRNTLIQLRNDLREVCITIKDTSALVKEMYYVLYWEEGSKYNVRYKGCALYPGVDKITKTLFGVNISENEVRRIIRESVHVGSRPATLKAELVKHNKILKEFFTKIKTFESEYGLPVGWYWDNYG